MYGIKKGGKHFPMARLRQRIELQYVERTLKHQYISSYTKTFFGIKFWAVLMGTCELVSFQMTCSPQCLNCLAQSSMYIILSYHIITKMDSKKFAGQSRVT